MTVSPLEDRHGAQPASLAKKLQLIATNALSGAVASLLTIAYCLSFSALLFQGQLAAGLGPGLWALLVGSAVAGLYVALTTSLPPAEAGPDNPAVAVLSVLAATVASAVFAAGGDAAFAIDHVLLSFSIATLATGLVLYLLGRLSLGKYVRFVPYPVIGGFLAASGWFLVTGGIEVMTGTDITLANLSEAIPPDRLPMLLLGVAFAIAVFVLKSWTGSTYVLPVAFIGGAAILDVALSRMGLVHGESHWFLSGASELKPWVPLAAVFERGIQWTVFLEAATEIGAVAGVTVIALLLDVTSLEVARTKSADLDWEFRTNGFANVIAAPLGGIMGNLSFNGSRLLEETGGFARISGVFASLVLVLIVVTGVDLPGYVPKPVLAGLLMYLGLVVLTEVLFRSPAHRAWADFVLAIAIAVAIVVLGYLAGIIFGVIAACLMFALSYSRIAVIRRHLTRSVIASNMDRSSSAARYLREEGDRIHIFWLSGFIFFGSSNGVFESIRDAIQTGSGRNRRFAVLDFSDVSGFDTSAVLSLVKLRNHADQHRVVLVFAGLSDRMSSALERLRLFDADGAHRRFATRDEAFQWCENEILSERETESSFITASDNLESWLAAELGSSDKARRLAAYFVRRDLAQGDMLYAQGSPADTIDLVIAGRIAVSISSEPGLELVVRRISTRTVVGEMGFFRGAVRTATVSAEEPTAVYTLSRARYEKMKAEDPEIAASFLEFIARTLSDRLDFANQGIAALS